MGVRRVRLLRYLIFGSSPSPLNKDQHNIYSLAVKRFLYRSSEVKVCGRAWTLWRLPVPKACRIEGPEASDVRCGSIVLFCFSCAAPRCNTREPCRQDIVPLVSTITTAVLRQPPSRVICATVPLRPLPVHTPAQLTAQPLVAPGCVRWRGGMVVSSAHS